MAPCVWCHNFGNYVLFLCFRSEKNQNLMMRAGKKIKKKNIEPMSKRFEWIKKIGKISRKVTVQALKYPSADAVTLYMPGFKAFN